MAEKPEAAPFSSHDSATPARPLDPETASKRASAMSGDPPDTAPPASGPPSVTGSEDSWQPSHGGGTGTAVAPYNPSEYSHDHGDIDADPSHSTEEESEEGGGPVKTFLEHLEDLRWTIIRCVASVAIAMVGCLFASNRIVQVLMQPLDQAKVQLRAKPRYAVSLEFGTNVVTINLSTNQVGPISLGTNRTLKLELAPVMVGTNLVLGLVPKPAPPDLAPAGNALVIKVYGPLGPFIVAIKIGLYGGIGLSSPFLLLFIGQFVVPALKRQEKKYLYRAVAFGAGLFILGVLFCYYVMLRIALSAAVQFSAWMTFGADEWRAEEYISFVVKFMLGMGLSFELPVILLTLVKIGILDYQRMNQYRPYWVVINMVLSAILTPSGDPVSLLLMAIPLQVLFEISVLIARYWYKRDQATAGETA